MAPDSAVIGSGPNGLAAAITLARAGESVVVLEAADTVGGGLRSAELTLPGFIHDVCSAIHPLGVASPFLKSVPLGEYGVEWIHPPAALAHPLDDGSAVVVERSISATAATLGPDARAYTDLMAPLVARAGPLLDVLLAPLFPPKHPLLMTRFGWRAMRSARHVAEHAFRGPRARALFAGLAAHSILPLEAPFSASFALTLGMLAHAAGWPLPRGGSQTVANALADYLRSFGGTILTGHRVGIVEDLPETPRVLFDLTPRAMVRLAGDRFPSRYRRTLERYRYGPGVFKVDWALAEPIPWTAADCARAGTVHLGGTLDEIAAAEREVAPGGHPERPFVLLAQPSLFDATRAPAGRHTAWAYCHVPNRSTTDMLDRIERQIERFAPGFKEVVMGRHVMGPAALERHNANLVGGDIVGGSNHAGQIIARPGILAPYRVPMDRCPVPGARCQWYLCSASTPPGGGVHGMCGFHAAQAALKARR